MRNIDHISIIVLENSVVSGINPKVPKSEEQNLDQKEIFHNCHHSTLVLVTSKANQEEIFLLFYMRLHNFFEAIEFHLMWGVRKC